MMMIIKTMDTLCYIHHIFKLIKRITIKFESVSTLLENRFELEMIQIGRQIKAILPTKKLIDCRRSSSLNYT